MLSVDVGYRGAGLFWRRGGRDARPCLTQVGCQCYCAAVSYPRGALRWSCGSFPPTVSIYGSEEACMTRVQRNLCRCLVVLVCLVVTLAVAQAQDDDAYIQYRQKVMVSNGANLGAIGDILKNK